MDWDVVDGKAQLIGDKLKNQLAGGSALADYDSSQGISGVKAQYYKLTSGTWQAADGQPVDLTTAIDLKIKTATSSDKDFAQYYGGSDAAFPGQAYDKLVKDGKAKTITANPLVLMASTLDLTNQTFAKAEQYFMANVAEIIMAKTDAVFDAEKKKALNDFKAMGLEKAQQEVDGNLAKSQELVKPLSE